MEGSTFGVIYLDDLPYQVPMEEYNQLATMLGKVTFGDFTADSDMLISSKIWNSLVGGMNAHRLREGQDDNNYGFSSGIDTTYPEQIGMLPKTVTVATVKYPLGDFEGAMYLASANALYSWNETTDAISASIGALTDAPVYRGVHFTDKLFIPQSDGFQTYDGASIAAQNTTVKAICFEIWDSKLYAITVDKKLYVTLDGSSWSLEYTLPDHITPKKLKLYMDNSGEEALFLSTSRGLYGWDDLSKKFVVTRIGPNFPPHPDNGLGIAHWRPGEDLFYTAGMDIFRFTGNAISPTVGLSQRQGLPAIDRGKIVDLCEGMNAMYALTQGVQEATAYEAALEIDPGMIMEPEFEVGLTDARNVLVQWNGFGWHPVDTPTASGVPAWIVVSGAASEYRLWWGVGDNCYTQRLSRTSLNLRQRIEVNEGEYQTSGVLEFGRWDGGMPMFDKLLSHVEIRTESVDLTYHDIQMEYRTDVDENWRALGGGVYQEGNNILAFNATIQDDGTIFSYGEICKWIELRLNTNTSDDTVNFLIHSVVLKFIKVPLDVGAWSYDVQIMTDVNWDRSAMQIKDEIQDFATNPRFVRLRHGSNPDRSHRVYVSRSSGMNMTGDDPRGARNLTLAQVRLDNYEGTETSVPGGGGFVGIA
jgi:hypothetical protein